MTMRSIFLAAAVLLAHAAPLAAQPGRTTYTLLVYEAPAQLRLREDTTAAGAAYWRAYADIGDSLRAAGVLRGGGAFRTGGATVRLEAGRVRSGAAPCAGTDAPLGGYFVIEVASLEEALRWASRIPAGGGAVEVHPAYPVPGMMPMR